MPQPLITTEGIVEYLRSAKTGYEVFDQVPSDPQKVRHGIYVGDPAAIDRTPYQLAVQGCGHIYLVTDSVEVIVISFQDDKLLSGASEAVTQLVNQPMMDGYHERTYTMDETRLNRAEYRIYEFDLVRLDFQTQPIT